MLTLLEGLLDEGVLAGVLRPGLRNDRVAGVILQAIMFNAFTATISVPPVRSRRLIAAITAQKLDAQVDMASDSLMCGRVRRGGGRGSQTGLPKIMSTRWAERGR